MLKLPAALRVTAVATGTGAIAADVAELPDRVWVLLALAACVTGLGAIQLPFTAALTERKLAALKENAQAYEAVTRALVTRPLDPRTPAPWPVLRDAQHGERRNGHGRHAMQ